MENCRVYIETYGCTSNQADSDIMRGIIKRRFILSDDSEKSDIVVINSCGVVEHTERKILRRIDELKKKGKKVVLAGCLPRIADANGADSIVTPDNLELIGDVIGALIDGKRLNLDRRKKIDKSELRCIKERLKENKIAIVSISDGCLGSCAYCATRFARGRLFSFKPENIVEEVKEAVSQGFKEIQLTSQDTAAYGFDGRSYNLADLLNEISKIEGEFRVRVGMMNPNNAIEILDELVDAFKSEKIFKFIHIPVQSGDNGVIERMNRNYTVEEFIEIVSAFRREFDDITLSTDIIVGFPGETDEEFTESCRLIEKVKPDIVNITRFSPRKGTPASKMKDMPDRIKKERSRILTELAMKIGEENNKNHTGKEYRVLVTKRGKKDTFLSRTDSYRPVILKGVEPGKFYHVRIVDFTFNYLRGKVVEK